MIAATSTGAAWTVVGAGAAAGAGADAGCAVGVAEAAAAGAAVAAADDEWPNMADMMFPKMLILIPPEV